MAKSTWSNTLECSKRARINKIGPDELLARRQAMSRTLIDRLGEVIEGLREKAVPKSPMGKAFTYAINRWSTLTVFLTDGRIPIDNLHVERRHRVVALGGRNCLFCGSDEGARRHAIISAVLLALPNREPGPAGSANRCRLRHLWGSSSHHPSCSRNTALCGARPRDGQAPMLRRRKYIKVALSVQ
jgi:hypothetical protein